MTVMRVVCCYIFILITVSINFKRVNCKNNVKKVSRSEEVDQSESQYESLENNLYKGLTNYAKTGNTSEEFNDALYSLVQNMENNPVTETRKQFISTPSDAALCVICNVLAKFLITYRELGLSMSALKKGLKFICGVFQTEAFCNGVIELNINIFVYIIDNRKDMSSSRICSIIGQANNCHDLHLYEDNSWSINIPPPLKKSAIENNKYRSNSMSNFRVLQLTDLHYDDIYEVGGNAECDEPLCCGSNQGRPQRKSAIAGPWGDYRKCDMPWHAVQQLMQQVSTHNDIDYVYHTGDIINHRVWETTLETNAISIARVYDIFKKTFQKKNIPVYPILGNHEPTPLDAFSPENISQQDLSTQWLYNLVAKEWSVWLPNSTLETIRKGGYYTVLVHPGFRIIALNSNVAYIYNWWLLYNDQDPYGQLQWLADTLYEAELNKEVVHILTHLPVGDSTTHKKWSHEYVRIIKRFAHIIKAQFCGHTHYDELHYFYDENNLDKPYNIGFNGGSFTTYTDVNPNYKIYDVNPHDMMVENIESWIFNLTEANQNGIQTPPKWYKLYSFKKDYNLNSMSLKNMGELLKKMTHNQTMLHQYQRFKIREGDPLLLQGCDKKCHETNICNMVTSEYGKTHACKHFLSQYHRHRFLLF